MIEDSQTPKEEVVNNNQDATPNSNPEISEQKSFSPEEELALQDGWKPKDEFKGNPDNWKPAKQFLKDGELLKAIHSLSRNNKELKQQIEALVDYNKVSIEQSYKTAYDKIKQEQLNAASVGDVRKVDELTNQLIELKETTHKPNMPIVDPIVIARDEFKRRHGFDNIDTLDVDKYDIANKASIYIHQNFPNLSPTEHFDRVEKIMLSQSKSNKVEQPMQKPIRVESNTPISKPTKISINDLPKADREMAKRLQDRLGDKFDLQAYINRTKQLYERN